MSAGAPSRHHRVRTRRGQVDIPIHRCQQPRLQAHAAPVGSQLAFDIDGMGYVGHYDRRAVNGPLGGPIGQDTQRKRSLLLPVEHRLVVFRSVFHHALNAGRKVEGRKAARDIGKWTPAVCWLQGKHRRCRPRVGAQSHAPVQHDNRKTGRIEEIPQILFATVTSSTLTSVRR